MLSIKVKCYNPHTNGDVDKLFDWHEESGRLCEVVCDSAYPAGICDTVKEAMYRAVELCQKHGLIVLSLE